MYRQGLKLDDIPDVVPITQGVGVVREVVTRQTVVDTEDNSGSVSSWLSARGGVVRHHI